MKLRLCFIFSGKPFDCDYRDTLNNPLRVSLSIERFDKDVVIMLPNKHVKQ